MFLQVPHDPVRLAAQGAAERLLPGVKPLVRFQILPQTEAFVALCAGVRPLPRVEPLVAAEALPQSERLGARRARVRLLSRVEALVSPEDLPPLERLMTDAAHVAVAGVGDDLLELPDAVSTGAEAADAMAGVKSLVAAEVFGQTGVALNIAAFGVVAPYCEYVHQLNIAGTRQLFVQTGQFQLHVQVTFCLLCLVHPLPNPNLSGS